MNLYLLSLLVYIVLITPLRLSVRLRAGRRPGYMLRLQVAGLPFYRRRKDEDPMDEQPIDQQEMTEQLQPEKLQTLRILLSKPVRQRLGKAVRLEWLSVYVSVSQPDAAQNALLYGALRTVGETLARFLGNRIPFRIHLQADHQGRGSEALLRCIISLRLGSLLPAALAWLWQLRRIRAVREPSKEEEYAASH